MSQFSMIHQLLRFQSEHTCTYRGKKGSTCWSIPESTIRKLMKDFYGTGDQYTHSKKSRQH